MEGRSMHGRLSTARGCGRGTISGPSPGMPARSRAAARPTPGQRVPRPGRRRRRRPRLQAPARGRDAEAAMGPAGTRPAWARPGPHKQAARMRPAPRPPAFQPPAPCGPSACLSPVEHPGCPLTSFAISIWRLAMRGLAIDVPSR
jgi:hypothetical protein